MITTSNYLKSEIAYRTDQATRGVRAHRGHRSRRSWVRSVAAAERGGRKG